MPTPPEPRRARVIPIEPDTLTLAPLALDPAAFQSPLPTQNYRVLFEDAAIGMVVGVWDTTTMQEAFGPYPGDEFITVLHGAFAILDAEGAAVRGVAGESACFRNGAPVSWKQDGFLAKIYLTLQPPGGPTPQIASAEGGVIVLDPGHAAPSRSDLATLHGASSRTLLFRNDTGRMIVSACRWAQTATPMAATPSHQLVRVLGGAITLTEPDGAEHTFEAGAHFFVPSGAACAWRIADATSAWHVDVATA